MILQVRGRCMSVIVCPLCEWRAKHTADTPQEVTALLARLLAEHTKEKHKETVQ